MSKLGLHLIGVILDITEFLIQAGQRPFFTPQMQLVRPRWQPMQQQQVRPSGMQSMPGAGQVPRASGFRQVPPRGVREQQPQPGGPGGPSQRLGGKGQPTQVRGGPGMQGQRPAFKFGQNVRNPPQGQQAIHIPVSDGCEAIRQRKRLFLVLNFTAS